ncbi:hypothetical protein GIY30_00845 [Gordonia sp. HNM0687]|uniref:DUF5313 domain-containing protein n=1 Tax=Gordonia mangrovi TaxID=2665643 RepID=A0A6L7GK86_9ACTN|nr:DUF5313 domain-containing protein [Gordonia mangrovi]MDY6808622.1 DUF5313 domain-containing protein [Actinomycetota bacterium]MXP19912.1 hypothetical protein [Gordonia mangrovi]UVF79466.1 DUF5313 domain-containing protein [Gordonia mangrovi]
MQTSTTSDRPRGLQYIRYCYGARMPKSMNEWVANDLAGPHATLRMVVRWAIPVLMLMLPFLLVPAPWDVRITMALPIPIAYVFFTLALNRVYRRHRLEQHGLDPDLIDKREKERNADLYDEYHRKYRGR